MSESAVIILAAGQGKRMRSPLPKPLVPVAGRPILDHLLDAAAREQAAAAAAGGPVVPMDQAA